MAYKTYTSEAIVCGSYAQSTADGSYLLFTKQAGMLYATARSIREEYSKQRFALQDFSHVKVSLVKGKTGWRIGSIEAIQNFYFSASDQAARGSVVNITRLLRRMYGGEEPDSELFDYLIAAFATLTVLLTNRQAFEEIVTARILLSLGYIDETKVPAEIKLSVAEQKAYLSSYPKLDNLSLLIDKALLSSQL